jgi:hypothetical protein
MNRYIERLTVAGCIGWGLVFGFVIWFLIVGVANAQNRPLRGNNPVPCHYVPNGAAITLQCANGYWHTTLPDGTIIEGNGMEDPNAGLRGSGIPIDGNGSLNIGRSAVTPPTQVAPVPAPNQHNLYGLPRTEE